MVKNKQQPILVIGDLHIDEKREQAIKVASNSIFSKIKGKKFSRVVVLGDMFNKTPSTKERLICAELLGGLKSYTKFNIDIITGTESHDFSKGLYNLADWDYFKVIKSTDKLQIGKYMFDHVEVNGVVYSNGYTGENDNLVLDKNLTYILGHIHKPQEFKNVIYLGSIYKTDFAEKNEEKRIAIIDIEKDEIKFIPIDSRSMCEVTLEGTKDKLSIQSDTLTKELDLKIKAMVNTLALTEVNDFINKIKSQHIIEYYQQEIQVKEQKIKVPLNLNQDTLLKNYCKEKGIDYNLVKKEI